MQRRALAAVVLAICFSTGAPAQDAQQVLEQAAEAMRVNDLHSLRYTGTGFFFAFGQNYSPADPWPRFRLEHYDFFVNYEHQELREEIIRTQAESPPRGGGNQPLIGPRQQITFLSQDAAWNATVTLSSLPEHKGRLTPLPDTPSPSSSPAPAAVLERQRQLWLTPHGFVKAARNKDVSVSYRTQRRRQLTILSFRLDDGTPVSGTLNDQHQIERIEARVPHPVLGDMLIENVFLNYKDFGGVMFPSQILQSQGGYQTLEVLVREVSANPSDRLTVPAAVHEARVEPPRVEVQPLGEGVWFLTGGSHNSVAVEFRDYVAVVEAPLNEERSMAVIEQVRRLAPGKPIRFLINTHHHFDHSGGLRAYAAEGATILTHVSNRRFFDLVLEGARQLYPDRLSRSGLHTRVEPIADSYELRNGGRSLEVHLVEGNLHNAGLLMVYLPSEQLLVEADAFTPGPPNEPPPATPNPFTLNLYENVQRLKLDVAQIAPIHGRVVPWSELLKAIGKEAPTHPDGMLRASF